MRWEKEANIANKIPIIGDKAGDGMHIKQKNVQNISLNEIF